MLLGWLVLAAGLQGGDTAEAPVAEAIRRRIEQAGQPPQIEIGGDLIHAQEALPAFYEQRLFRSAWDDPAAVAALLDAIRAAGDEGLRPADYHLERIEMLRRRLEEERRAAPMLRADLDLLLTDSFLIYGSHLLSGRVDPETFDPEWLAVRRERDLLAILASAVESGRIAESLADLLPEPDGYRRLRDTLARYRGLASAGGWHELPAGPALRLGDTGERVAALRQRLQASGDLPPEAAASSTDAFDRALEAAVVAFQDRHGLDADGVVGRKTLAVLNVPATRRVRQIELNLERWRWLPQDLGDRFVVVNIPDFSLRVFEGNSELLRMPVVVGRAYRRTPVFSDRIRYLVLNPSWEIPHKLAVQDKLPLIRADPGYLAAEHIRVLDGWGADAREIDPREIDWSTMSARTFRYRLRQDPGPWNALGRVKFMFPNRFNVYLHDTPTREHFTRAERGLSSGCIRLGKPIDLAVLLLQGAPGWNRERILATIATGEERTVPLPQPVPVHLLYWTAWVTPDGIIHFREDLYGRDRLLDQALQLPPPEEPEP